MTLPTDQVIPVKLVLKVKLNAHGGRDKLKGRVCKRDVMLKRMNTIFGQLLHHQEY